MAEEDTVGREPIAIIEIDQPQCSLVYGTSPCTAVLGTTGDHKCLNTFTSCQDTANYNPVDTVTLRLVTPRSNLPKDLGTLIPCLRDYSTSPGTIRIDDGLGKRASVSATVQDFPYHDRLVDKYASERVTGAAQADGVGYDPAERGTFWTKWLRRNPFYQGYAMRVREGYVGQALGAMRTRHYVLERIDGPDSAGTVRITAKDVLKLADDDRSQVPAPSDGRLDSAINDSTTSATLTPAGIGNSDYPASGLIRIGDELMDFTRSGDSLTITRGVRGTAADSHDADDTVQLCYTMSDSTLSDVLDDVFQNYTPIEASWIPKTDWDDEVSEWLTGFELTGEITEPTGVSEVTATLLKQSLCFMWWDEYGQEIKLRAFKPPQADEGGVTELNDDEHLIMNSVAYTRQPERRRSRVYVYYDIIDPTTDRNEPANYRKLRGVVDADAESDNEFGETRVQNIFAPFWDETNTAATVALANRKLARLRNTPEMVEFSVDAKDRTLGMSAVVDLSHRNGVDLTGAVEARRYQVTERNEVEPGHRVRYKVQNYEFAGRYCFITENSYPDYPSATDAQRANGGFICENTGLMGDGSEGYKVV